MGKEYKFRGYTFRATSIMTEVMVNRFGAQRREVHPLYEIDGLKEAGTRPFLTSLNQVKGYIECVVYAKKRHGKERENNAD